MRVGCVCLVPVSLGILTFGMVEALMPACGDTQLFGRSGEDTGH
jgi:hypothetical protein